MQNNKYEPYPIEPKKSQEEIDQEYREQMMQFKYEKHLESRRERRVRPWAEFSNEMTKGGDR